MNMDVDYMVHKNRIQQHLREAAQDSSRNQNRYNKEERASKNKIRILLASVVKMVLTAK